MRNQLLQVLMLSLIAVVGGCTCSNDGQISGDDLAEMKRATRTYSEAWLSNDPEAVMATFVSEPVLSPSGLPFIEGQAAARNFWWPPGAPSAIVTLFEYEELEARGSGDIGYVRGNFTLGFHFDGVSYKNTGKFVHILKKSPDGEWHISHHIWNDLPLDEGS